LDKGYHQLGEIQSFNNCVLGGSLFFAQQVHNQFNQSIFLSRVWFSNQECQSGQTSSQSVGMAWPDPIWNL